MRTVYAARYTVTSRLGGKEVSLEGLKSACATWISRKYERAWKLDVELRFDGGLVAPRAGHSLVAQHRRIEEADLVTVDWSHPDDSDTSVGWVTSVTVAQHEGRIELSAAVRISATRFQIRPFTFAFGTPRILVDVLNGYNCAVDGQPVATSPTRLAAPQVAAFVQEVLLSPSRNLPVVLISPDSWTGLPSIEPKLLSATMLGLAQVAVLDDKWAAFKLTDLVGRDLTCFDGAVRLYWPGFQLTDSRLWHKLYLANSIRILEDGSTPLQKRLFRLLCSIACFRFTDGEITRAARQLVAAADRADVERIRFAMKAGEVDKGNLQNQLLDALIRCETLEKENEQLRADLEHQKAAWATYRQFDREAEEDDVSTDVHARSEFATVFEAYEAAASKAPDSIVFLESAGKSAQESHFKNPNRVYELLEAISEVSKAWKKNNGRLGTSWEAAFEKMGFEYKDQISQTTRTKFKKDYTFVYGDVKVLMQKHVTIGSGDPNHCLSVHWHRDDERHLIVIGHCGIHLPNTKT